MAQAIKGMDAGYVVAVVQQDPAGVTAAGADALVTLGKGGTVTRHIGAGHHRDQNQRRTLLFRVQVSGGVQITR